MIRSTVWHPGTDHPIDQDDWVLAIVRNDHGKKRAIPLKWSVAKLQWTNPGGVIVESRHVTEWVNVTYHHRVSASQQAIRLLDNLNALCGQPRETVETFQRLWAGLTDQSGFIADARTSRLLRALIQYVDTASPVAELVPWGDIDHVRTS